MAFKFKFEALQRHRKTLRDLAQRDFADAQAAASEQMQFIEALYQQIDLSNEKSIEIRNTVPVDMEQLKSIEEFVELQKIKIEQEREKARELLSIAEEKQEALVEKAQEYKVVEILREKEHKKYLEKVKHIESQEMDDMNLMRHSRS